MQRKMKILIMQMSCRRLPQIFASLLHALAAGFAVHRWPPFFVACMTLAMCHQRQQRQRPSQRHPYHRLVVFSFLFVAFSSQFSVIFIALAGSTATTMANRSTTIAKLIELCLHCSTVHRALTVPQKSI